MADIVFNCTYCNESLIVDDRGVGLEVPCPHCLHKIEIPSGDDDIEESRSGNEANESGQLAKSQANQGKKKSASGNTRIRSRDEWQRKEGDYIPGEGSPDNFGVETLGGQPVRGNSPELTEDSAQTVLALLESLLESQPVIRSEKVDRNKSDKEGGISLQEKDVESVNEQVERKLIFAVTELKDHMNHVYRAYRDAGDRVANLTNENSQLRERIEVGEVEREDLSARLDDFSESISMGKILNKDTSGQATAESWSLSPIALARRLCIPYQIAVCIMMVSTGIVIYGLYRSTAEARMGNNTVSSGANVLEKEEPTESIEFHTLPLGKIERYRPLEVKVSSVGLCKGSDLPDVDGTAGLNRQDEFLFVRILLKNMENDQAIHMKYLWDAALLTDGDGNKYKPVGDWIDRDKLAENERADNLGPEKSAELIAVFEAPSVGAKRFNVQWSPGLWLADKQGDKARARDDGFTFSFERSNFVKFIRD